MRDELIRTVLLLVVAVGGPGACREVGYVARRRPDGSTLHQLYAVVDRVVRGSVIGRQGVTAAAIRTCLKGRAASLQLDSYDGVEVFIAGGRDWADEEGILWVPPPAV